MEIPLETLVTDSQALSLISLGCDPDLNEGKRIHKIPDILTELFNGRTILTGGVNFLRTAENIPYLEISRHPIPYVLISPMQKNGRASWRLLPLHAKEQEQDRRLDGIFPTSLTRHNYVYDEGHSVNSIEIRIGDYLCQIDLHPFGDFLSPIMPKSLSPQDLPRMYIAQMAKTFNLNIEDKGISIIQNRDFKDDRYHSFRCSKGISSFQVHIPYTDENSILEFVLFSLSNRQVARIESIKPHLEKHFMGVEIFYPPYLSHDRRYVKILNTAYQTDMVNQMVGSLTRPMRLPSK